MIAICRNKHCPKPNGEYDTRKAPAGLPKGYCTKKCVQEVAKHYGWTEATEKKRGGLTAEQVVSAKRLVGVIKREAEPGLALEVLSPGAQEVAKGFSETTLTFTLRIPDQPTLELLKDPEAPWEAVEQLPLESDADYKVMDMERIRLLDEADAIDAKRTDDENGTGGLNKVKNAWDVKFNPAIKARKGAAGLLAERMKAYDEQKEANAKLIQEEEQRLAQEEQDRLEAQARELDAKAEKAKGPKKQELEQQAHLVRRAAVTTPTEFTSAGFTRTETAGSSRAKLFKGRVTDTRQALETLLNILGPEWLAMVEFKQGMLNNLGKMNNGTRVLPGFEFKEDTNFRRGKR
jgi:hypothetical protein